MVILSVLYTDLVIYGIIVFVVYFAMIIFTKSKSMRGYRRHLGVMIWTCAVSLGWHGISTENGVAELAHWLPWNHTIQWVLLIVLAASGFTAGMRAGSKTSGAVMGVLFAVVGWILFMGVFPGQYKGWILNIRPEPDWEYLNRDGVTRDPIWNSTVIAKYGYEVFFFGLVILLDIVLPVYFNKLTEDKRGLFAGALVGVCITVAFIFGLLLIALLNVIDVVVAFVREVLGMDFSVPITGLPEISDFGWLSDVDMTNWTVDTEWQPHWPSLPTDEWFG